jgi:hypothetical protein
MDHAGIDRDRQDKGKCGGNDRADVRDKPQNGGQNAPQDGTWNPDQPQSCPDQDPETGVDQKLVEK